MFKDNVIEVIFGSGRGFFVTSIQEKDIRAVERAASEVLGRETKVRFAEENATDGGPIRPGRELESAMKDPAVQFFMDTFKAQVLSADPVAVLARRRAQGPGPDGERTMKNVMDLQKMLKSAKEMQDRLQKELAALRDRRVERRGHGHRRSRRPQGPAVHPHRPGGGRASEDVEMLQDLIVAAFNDAAAKVDEALAEKLGGLGAGLKIPGLG